MLLCLAFPQHRDVARRRISNGARRRLGSQWRSHQSGDCGCEIADQIFERHIKCGTTSDDHAIPTVQRSRNSRRTQRMRQASAHAIAFVRFADFFCNREAEARSRLHRCVGYANTRLSFHDEGRPRPSHAAAQPLKLSALLKRYEPSSILPVSYIRSQGGNLNLATISKPLSTRESAAA